MPKITKKAAKQLEEFAATRQYSSDEVLEKVKVMLNRLDFQDWHVKRFTQYIAGSEPRVHRQDIDEDLKRMLKLL